MASTKELETELRQLKAILTSLGIPVEAVAPVSAENRVDFIPHGSPEHATFLGLVPAQPGDEDHITFTSPRSGNAYHLEDEITQFMNYHDPEKAAQLTLQQKVNELEIKPEVPEDAKPMWRPMGVPI